MVSKLALAGVGNTHVCFKIHGQIFSLIRPPVTQSLHCKRRDLHIKCSAEWERAKYVWNYHNLLMELYSHINGEVKRVFMTPL